MLIRPRGYEKIFMLNSDEREILNVHKCKKYQEIQFSDGTHKHIKLFFLLINVKMPTIIGILTLMSSKNFMLI